jgi:hypothetical protein
MDIRYIGIVVIWYAFSHFGILPQEKSGNPGRRKSNFRGTSNEKNEKLTFRHFLFMYLFLNIQRKFFGGRSATQTLNI